MDNRNSILTDTLPDQAIFALDIGTRSIIGMVGIPDGDRIHIVAIERAEHTKRAMIDGQIEDIDQVAKIAGQVKERLEKKLGCKLVKVCVAAAGRALRTESVTFEMELARAQKIDAESVSRLEAGAISEAEKQFMNREGRDNERQFYLVGYTVSRYFLDNYMISNLLEHHGRVLKADIIATFLPTEVVESLYAAMHKIGLEVASLTLEPIAAINAAIPQNIRLLNLAMVDIGAGTSDIAVCRDGSVTGYTMAILAGDEITESIMKEYLVDFSTAEKIKSQIDEAEELKFTDILGFEQTITREAVFGSIKEASSRLCQEISEKILEVNGGMPSAVFLAGGGSRLAGLKEGIVEHLKIDSKRVAIAGNNFKINAYSDEYDLENPEYATPLGIVISAGFNIVNDGFRVILNDRPAKLFRGGTFTVMDVLMMNGYNYQDMIGRSGQNLVISVNGKRTVFYGEKAEPSVLTLNGEEAQLSDQVSAEDWIVFVPASHGKSASAMLSDIEKPGSGKRILVNGIEAKEDVSLKTGDSIIIETVQTKEDLADQALFDSADEEQELLDESVSVPQNVPGILIPPAQMVSTDIKLDQRHPQDLVQSETAFHKSDGKITFFLNDKPITLPVKADQRPYYLMDMLEYSGLDFKNLTGRVVLEVNGESGYFQQELKSRDRILIYQVNE
ncbi:cell division protein FtsA [Lacrimispora amygdalina]|uniref:cell division protein FtsA n=1 Tax=Lacrimispora amygdalina TaxID=253257 RepID=UPI000BE22100|nr:cell division FtsA domain-containing protein [Lacrimispora amygdalina]